MNIYSRFESEIAVRPDDIDLNNHLHFSKYLDYVLAARYDQMKRCYNMPMDEFIVLGLNWVATTLEIKYKRAIYLGDTVIVTTWIEEVFKTGVKVGFEIRRKENRKLSADGHFEFSLINISSGKITEIPEIVLQKYSI